MSAATDIRQLREDAIVQAAADLFLERGIEAVKMTDIATRCGVGVATLYRYFGTKTRLVISAGILLWSRFLDAFQHTSTSPRFLKADGCTRLRLLMENYIISFREHAEFISFLDEFDHLMLAEKVDAAELVEYDREVQVFYPLFRQAYLQGVADGSVVNTVDFPTFYRSVNHALMGVAQKLIRGEILPSDDFSEGIAELECIVEMAVGYLAGR